MKSSKPSAITAAPSSSIGAGLAGSGRHHHGARSLDAHRPEGRPPTCRRDGSLLTHRWREPDSNPRSLPMSTQSGHVCRRVMAFAAGLELAFFDHCRLTAWAGQAREIVFDKCPNRTRLAGPHVGAFWRPGDPALISLPGPAWLGAR